ncbi:zinc finger protein 354A-like [Acanthaster planci]|uniref:Zinc finger protein 354A-like n=1 Tax=Acanthaster planci TaxID=133434 RepID=A0A8B7ZJ24_ACAPL|nr:zinc finger protein 354A-like [Acanthaster planci]
MQYQATHGVVRVAQHIHRGPVRYNCTHCTKRFRDKKDWRQHENTHTGFKPYSCKVCGKKLSRPYSLKKHMLTHSEEKPIVCANCKQSFRRISGLLLHQKQHHPWIARHACCLCKTTHEGVDDLERHIRSDHVEVVRVLASKFFGDKQALAALSNPKSSKHQRTNVISDQANPEDAIVIFLSRRDQQVDRTTASLYDEAVEEYRSFNRRFRTYSMAHTSAEGNRDLGENTDVEDCHVPTETFSFNHQEPGVALTEKLFSSSNSSCVSDSSIKRRTRRYKCTYCGWQFSNSDVFRRHQCRQRRTLHKRNRLSCSNCKEIFNKREQLQLHLQSCGFFCSLCSQNFKTKGKLKAHLENLHMGPRARHQSRSEEEFGSTPSMTVDKDLSSDEPAAAKLPISSAETSADRSPFHNVEVEGLEEVNTNAQCFRNFKFTSSTKMSKQRRAKHAVVTCRVCHKNFSHGYALKLHLMMHASETEYRCRQCARCFSSKKGLTEHRKSHAFPHQTYDVASPDSVRDEQRKNNGVLFRENLKSGSHLEVRRFQSQALQTKPHKCVYCGWGFWTRKDCVIHERTHTGEKPYVCDTCGKSFARNYSLKLHSLTHDGMKPFRCKYCNKGFSSGGYVKIHERIHTKEKPYTCRGCAARFSCSSSLTRHEKSCKLEDEKRQGTGFSGSWSSVQSSSSVKRGFLKCTSDGHNSNESIIHPKRWLRYKCRYRVCFFCGWRFGDGIRSQRHQNWHRKRYHVEFLTLKATLVSQSRCKETMKTSEAKDPLHCERCDKHFRGPNAQRFHINHIHAVLCPFSCACCHRGFQSYTDFKNHLKTCTHDKMKR